MSLPETSTESAAPRPKPTSRLAVALLEAADEVIVLLGGEAGVMEVGALEDSLLPLAARCPKSVTFDLIELRFISSMAIDVLVHFRRAAVRRGVLVYLAPDMRPEVRDVLQVTGVLGLFEDADDPHHAPLVAKIG
jgi:anti-anti-sigma factor